MFQNSYQNGSYFDFLDPKCTFNDIQVNQQKLKPLYKTTNIPQNHKIFDKQLKTYVFQSLQNNSKIVMPRQQKKDLYLIQQYLVLQIYFFQGMSWNIELTLSDLTKTKRRIIFSPSTTKTQLKPFFIKTICKWQEGVWNTFVVDLYSYMDAFKGQTYRSLDTILLSGCFKLRRIYTTSTEPIQCHNHEEFFEEVKPTMNFLPKQFYIPMGVPTQTVLNRYDLTQISQTSQIEHSTKNSSFLKSSKTRQNTSHTHTNTTHKSRTQIQKPSKSSQKYPHPPKKQQQPQQKPPSKTQKTISQTKDVKIEQKKKKDFLSNTNGQLIGHKKKQQQRLSIDKNSLSQKMNRGKSNPKGKANPWRSNHKQSGLTDASNLAVSKHESYRKAITPQNCTAFKKSKVQSGNQFNQTKNKPFQGYSDTQYVQLSQKFSTFTDGKFLKTGQNQLPQPPTTHQHEHQQQIQQNIQLQTNSMYSSKRQQQQKKQPLIQDIQFVKESINDSLDMFQKKQKVEQMGRSSLYGFGENLMRNFMEKNIQRPYSPPINQRQSTQSQPHNKPIIEKDQVQLIFDPVLNCYYDYRTHTYYQLKN